MALRRNDIVRVPLSGDEIELARSMAKAAELGGASRVRGSDRAASLATDQFVGVGIGELAGNKYFFSVDHYVRSREKKNRDPMSGDGGSDTIGFKIDYKASLAKKPDLLSYNLVVRPAERHAGFIYVLVLVRLPGPEAYLVGWANDGMLSGRMSKSGIFEGAYVVPATQLWPVSFLKRFPELIGEDVR